MEIVTGLTIPPNEGQLMLLRYLLVITLLLHFPYIGLVLGASVFSLGFNVRDRDESNPLFARLAKDLMDLVLPNRGVAIVLGVLPVFVLWMIHEQWLHGSTASTMSMLLVGAVVVTLGLGPLYAYRSALSPDGKNSETSVMLGTIGVATLLLGTYIVIGSLCRFNDPERWHLVQGPVRRLLSFNIIWKHMYFVLSGIALTGCAMLFFFFSWSNDRIKDADYARFVKNFGAGVAMACLLVMPVIGFFYVVTSPIISMSGAVFVLMTATVVIFFLIFIYLYRDILNPRARFGTHAFLLFVLVFFLVSVADQQTLVNATREHSAALVAAAEEREAQIALEREAKMAETIVVDVARGEEVFNSVCVTCHRLDERLVGPPLGQVVPKYGTVDDLAAFVQNPKKVDPEYPPMPAPGLSIGDAKSVAAFLLEKVTGAGGEAPTEGGGEEIPDTRDEQGSSEGH